MNKEEIEEEYFKSSKEYIEFEIKENKLINGYTDIYIFQEEVKLLLKYIKKLEQKETILDKVTDKLLEDKKELMEELKYNITKREARMQLNLVDKYLGIIIEGEKE